MQYEPYKYYQEIEKPASVVFSAMEARGFCIDVSYLEQLKPTLEALQKPIKEAIYNELGAINLNSPKQLLEALNAKQIQPTLKGKPSTDQRALQSLKRYPVVSKLLEYSELETLLSSFVTPYLERQTSIVHPFFNQCGTRTGRPSCSNPNLLQIPKRKKHALTVRRMFVARQGMSIGSSDYKQIEPKMLAVLSQDPNMLNLFANGIDFHTYFAERLNISRESAKVFDLETYYRATKYGVARELKCSLAIAQKEIDKAWGLFPQLRVWEEKLIHETKRTGYCTTLFGRRIKIEGLDSTEYFFDRQTGEKVFWKRDAAERQLMNNMGQGSAGEVMKKAMVKVHNDTRLSPGFGLLVQIYDDLTSESPDMEHDKHLVIDGMENAVELGIPLTVDFKSGPNWAECK